MDGDCLSPEIFGKARFLSVRQLGKSRSDASAGDRGKKAEFVTVLQRSWRSVFPFTILSRRRGYI